MPLFSPPTLLENARWAGKRIGILGGSFAPPHEGHVHISLSALKALKLDAIWWLVTPQNPLKGQNPFALEDRVRACEKLTVDHPRILVTDLEKDLGTNITYNSVRAIKAHFPKTDFVWITGMDNAHSMHRWNHWRPLMHEIAMLHITRPPAKDLVRQAPIRMVSNHTHVCINKSGRYPLNGGRTYWMMQNKMVDISSTQIRKKSLKKQ